MPAGCWRDGGSGALKRQGEALGKLFCARELDSPLISELFVLQLSTQWMISTKELNGERGEGQKL